MKNLLLLSGAAAALLLAAALVAQYGFGLRPCELCIAQRVPYGLVVLVAAGAALVVKSFAGLRKAAVLCGLLFAADGAIAIYHSGVEYGVFAGPSGCTNHDRPDQTIEEMRAAIMNAQLVPCDQPMAYFLGLSMASWNVVAALVMTGFVFYRLRKTTYG